MSLQDFNMLVEGSNGQLMHNGQPVKTIAYIYCVGNRQSKGENKYCSRQCCTAAIHSSLNVHEKFKGVKAFHLYRDIRTYGKHELLYEESSRKGDIYIRFDEKEPPVVEIKNGKPFITVKDYLTSKKELTLDADLVVLVTGMVPRSDSTQISELLKIPIGNDKFFNEVHPKLKPVETVIKGIYIGGACQGPKNISESYNPLSEQQKSTPSAVRASNPSPLWRGCRCCAWCNKCAEVSKFDAVKPIESSGKMIAEINISTCTGCGICPYAPLMPLK